MEARREGELVARARVLVASLDVESLVRQGILPGEGRFMPVVTYPPITMYPPVDAESLIAPRIGLRGGTCAVYVHIPFCSFQCHYCHWVKKVNPPPEVVDGYLDLLRAEMDIACGRLGTDRIPATSILIGGGTPTYLSARQLSRFFDDLRRTVDLAACRQFSVEAEPKSIVGPEGYEKLAILRANGVDRISLGVQSFQDHVLRAMGRAHSGADAREAIRQVRRAGFDSLSIDLIYGYEDQTLSDWIGSLEAARYEGVDAWHLYRLRIWRHGDVRGRVLERYRTAKERFPDVDQVRLMKAIGIVFSHDCGYRQYFTRIFATRPKHVSQYMWDYCCNLSDVVGFGISSWSNYDRVFTLNVGGDFERYGEMVRAGRMPVDRGLVRDDETDARRSFISSLKNTRVIKVRFFERTGRHAEEHFGPEISRLADLGLVDQDDESVFLTDRGRFFADETVMQMFQKRYLPFPELAHPLMPE